MTDGDEGLFASYSDVQFQAPVRAGDVIEISARDRPGRQPQSARWPSRSGWSDGATPSGARRPPTCWSRPSWQRRRVAWSSSPARDPPSGIRQPRCGCVAPRLPPSEWGSAVPRLPRPSTSGSLAPLVPGPAGAGHHRGPSPCGLRPRLPRRSRLLPADPALGGGLRRQICPGWPSRRSRRSSSASWGCAVCLAVPDGCGPTAGLRGGLGRRRGAAGEGALWRVPVGQARVLTGGLALRAPGVARRCALRRVRPRARRCPSRWWSRLEPVAVCRWARSRSRLPWPSGWAVRVAVPLPTDGPTAQFVGVQGNVPRPGLDFNAERRAVLDNHVNATLAAAAEGAGQPRPDLYVWPENSSDIDPLRNADANQLIRNTVDQIGVPLIVGGLLEEPAATSPTSRCSSSRGRATRIATSSATPCRSASTSPTVPSGASSATRSTWCGGTSTPDRDRSLHRASRVRPEIRAGLSICFEVAYDDIMRDVVDAGANVLVVQTNNATFGYTAESPQQLAISRCGLWSSVVPSSTCPPSARVPSSHPTGRLTRSPRCSPRPSFAAPCLCVTRCLARGGRGPGVGRPSRSSSCSGAGSACSQRAALSDWGPGTPPGARYGQKSPSGRHQAVGDRRCSPYETSRASDAAATPR